MLVEGLVEGMILELLAAREVPVVGGMPITLVLIQTLVLPIQAVAAVGHLVLQVFVA
jgi:hypothetical protein